MKKISGELFHIYQKLLDNKTLLKQLENTTNAALN